MLLLGVLREAELKFYVADVGIFGSMILGIYWGESRYEHSLVRSLTFWYKILTVILAVNVAGLFFGFIPPSQEGSRVYNYGLFGNAAIVSILFPIVHYNNRRSQRIQATRVSRYLPVVGIGTCICAAFLAGTRSMLFVALCSIAVTIWLHLDGMKRVLSVVVIAVFCLTFEHASVSNAPIANNVLLQRIMSTDIESSSRYEEVILMFEQLKGNVFFGLGFGSRFWSPIDREANILVMNPHVAVLTLWLKGGAGVFVLLMALPVTFSATNVALRRGCVSRNGETKQLPLAVWSGSCLIYAVQGSMSGGWQCCLLFLFGAFVACANSQPKRLSRGEFA
jgi:hypothetical protein